MSEQRTRDARANRIRRGSWRQDTLGKILPIKYGKARSVQSGYPRPETATFGSNGAFGVFDRALTTKPALIVGRKGAAGAVHYSHDPCWPIDTAFYTEGNEGTFLPFFRYLLESQQLVALDRSTAVPSLSRDDYDARAVSYPESVEEQSKIVEEIEKQFTRLDAGVAALRRVQANLKCYRAAVLKAACEGRLVPTEAELARKEGRSYEAGEQLLPRILVERRRNWTGRGEYKPATVPNADSLPQLPEGWTWASMRQVGDIQLGRQRAPQHHHGDNMRHYLRVANIFEDHIDVSDVMSMNFTPVEFEKYRLQRGDILLNEGQTPELVGRAAMFSDDVADCCYQKTLLRFRAFSGILPRFALTVFRAYMHNGRFKRAASITTNIAHLTAEKFVEIEFPIPPLAEQERIVYEVERRLTIVEQLKSVASVNLRRATRLRQSILERAFSGRLHTNGAE